MIVQAVVVAGAAILIGKGVASPNGGGEETIAEGTIEEETFKNLMPTPEIRIGHLRG